MIFAKFDFEKFNVGHLVRVLKMFPSDSSVHIDDQGWMVVTFDSFKVVDND